MKKINISLLTMGENAKLNGFISIIQASNHEGTYVEDIKKRKKEIESRGQMYKKKDIAHEIRILRNEAYEFYDLSIERKWLIIGHTLDEFSKCLLAMQDEC